MKKLMTIWIKVDADTDDDMRLAETKIRGTIELTADIDFDLNERDIAIDIDAVDVEDDEDDEVTT